MHVCLQILCKEGRLPFWKWQNGSWCFSKVVIQKLFECKEHCGECTSENDCQKCNSLYKFYDNNCIEKWIPGTHDSGTKCQKCKIDHCENCDSSAGTCQKCFCNYKLLTQNGVQSYVESCPEGTLTYNKECVACDKSCKSSSISVNTCDSCQNGFFYMMANVTQNAAIWMMNQNKNTTDQIMKTKYTTNVEKIVLIVFLILIFARNVQVFIMLMKRHIYAF